MNSLEAVLTWPLRVTFPEGFIGVPDWQHFTLEPAPGHRQVWVLQSEDDLDACFLLVDPHGVDAAYNPAIAPEDLHRLDAASTADLVIACTARVSGKDASMTVNLLGPLLVNPQAGLAMQVVLYDSEYATDHPATVPGRSLATAS